MNASTWILWLMINYITLFVYIGLLAKTWKNLRYLLKILSWILNLFLPRIHIRPYWYKGDKITGSRTKLEITTSHYRLTQIINEPSLILEYASSCIDLIFTFQPNMVVDSAIHSSLHPNSHYQILFTKFNLKVYYPPPYERNVWHYRYANTAQIKNTLASFNWKQAHSNSSFDKKMSIFNETIINVMCNFSIKKRFLLIRNCLGWMWKLRI